MTGLCVAVASVAVLAPAVSAAPRHGGSSTATIADVLLSDSSKDDANGFDRRWFDYDIATQAVLLFPDLVAAASDPSASLTVFLPNDYAFRALVHDLTGQQLRTEKEVFDAVAGLGLDTVKAVLTYHIIGAKIDPLTLLRSDGAQETTLNGATLTVDIVGRFFAKLVDNDPNDRDPYVVQYSVGGRLANGYVHGISQVLRPIDL
ncbi:MAG: fasciclin domain-containing protein [Ilumatobacteraceae bacterium]